MFFSLCPDQAVLSDTNDRLINAYKQVRDNLEDVILHLEILQKHHDHCIFDGPESFYYEVRRHFNGDSAYSPEQAARMIYLNKTCFNGLYRENKKGEMNSPKGEFKTGPQICDRPTLEACSKALNKPGVTIMTESWDRALERVTKHSTPLVFCDPPYMPLPDQKSNFSAYQAGGFDLQDQENLERALWDLVNGGTKVLTSNALSARELYSRWETIEVQTRRSIAAKEGGRKPLIELLFKGG
jgi:DNA adenine methylase